MCFFSMEMDMGLQTTEWECKTQAREHHRFTPPGRRCSNPTGRHERLTAVRSGGAHVCIIRIRCVCSRPCCWGTPAPVARTATVVMEDATDKSGHFIRTLWQKFLYPACCRNNCTRSGFYDIWLHGCFRLDVDFATLSRFLLHATLNFYLGNAWQAALYIGSTSPLIKYYVCGMNKTLVTPGLRMHFSCHLTKNN